MLSTQGMGLFILFWGLGEGGVGGPGEGSKDWCLFYGLVFLLSPLSEFIVYVTKFWILDSDCLLYTQACHTKAEYEEYGASICRTNPVFKGMY